MVIVTLCLVALTILVILVVNWWLSVHGRLYRNKTLPVPTDGDFLFGHAHAAEPMYGEAGVRWFTKWATKYPVFRYRLGFMNMVATAHPKYIRAVFADKPDKSWYLYTIAHRWLGDGLIFSRGEKWHTRRKLLTPSFHFDILRSYIHIFNETTNLFVEQINKTGCEPVEIFPKALLLTLDTVLQCLVNYETNCQTQDHEYTDIMFRLTKIVISRVFNPLKFPDVLFHPTPAGAEYRKLLKRFMDLTKEIIHNRKELHKQNPEMLNDSKNLNFLDVLLTLKYDDGTHLRPDEVLEEANNFIFAGHDTTASSISWGLYLLTQNPVHLEKCYKEIRDVFDAENGDRFVSQQQINSLPHFGLCIKECMRMKSAVPWIGRDVAKDITIDGHFIPKGTNMMVLIDVLHQSEEFWERPQEFYPERFSPENSKNRDPYCYIPFSAGNRNCIGQNFALTELKMAVAKIIYNFDVVAENPKGVSRINAMVMKPVNLNLKFIPRTNN